MKSRPETDPRSFLFQANIHGWPDYNGTAESDAIANKYNWQQCQHGQYYFLIWHRMYLYFYERIVRKASGNPKFALPYWDYSDRELREIPQPFRIPDNEKENPLYVSKRCLNINEGKPIPYEITNPYPALRSRFFAANKSNELNVCHSFGGGRVDSPAFVSNREGLLEQIPHDIVHLYCGGPTGLMSDLCAASQDPIFYLHHNMIERVWESWTQLGGNNPKEDSFLKTKFTFYDENGHKKTVSVQEFVDLSKLDYRYDSLLKIEDRVEATTNENPKLYISIDETKDLFITSTKRSITLNIKPEFYSLYKQIAEGKVDMDSIRFTLQARLGGSISRHYFHMYLNLPLDTIPYPSRYNFIGTLAIFEGHCIPKNKRQNIGINSCFDITDNLFKILKSEYNFNGKVPTYLNLTIVPKSCDITHYPDTKPGEYIIAFLRTLVIHFYPEENKKLPSK